MTEVGPLAPATDHDRRHRRGGRLLGSQPSRSEARPGPRDRNLRQ